MARNFKKSFKEGMAKAINFVMDLAITVANWYYNWLTARVRVNDRTSWPATYLWRAVLVAPLVYVCLKLMFMFITWWSGVVAFLNYVIWG